MELVIINRPQVSYCSKICAITKRVLDLALCILFLPLTAPLMGLLALLIHLDSPGPALFVQERIGKGERVFQMYKFRTMTHNLEDASHRAFMKAFVRGEIGDNGHRDPQDDGLKDAFSEAFVNELPDVNDNNGRGNSEVYKPAHTSQITWVGHILRKTSLDELPQILNILKGEMSLIGPRPNVPWEVEEYQPWHYERLEALPGITGLAQVRGRSGISFDTIVKYDIEYIRKQSVSLDLKILWWTVSTVFHGVGAE